MARVLLPEFSSPSKAPGLALTAAWLRWSVKTLLLWYERARQRRALRALDDHLLSDIGRSREEADREARRPFWQD